MNRPSPVRLPVVLLSAALLFACGDSASPDTNRVATVTIAPADPALLVGDDLQLTATARNSAGDVVSGKTASWSSSAPTVASVTSGGGLVSGVTAGTAQITATIDGKSATVTATVTAAGVAPTITGVSPSPLVPGSGATLTGSDLTGTTQVWVNGVRAVVSAASAAGVQFTVPCVAPGAAVVVARNGTASSADFAANVNATPSAAMTVGDFQTLSGMPCLQLGASAIGQTYLVGLQSVSEDVSSLTPVTFGIDVAAGAAAATLADAPALLRTGSAFGAVPPVLIGDTDQARWQAHRRAEHTLRARELAQMTPRFAEGRLAMRTGVAAYSATAVAAAVPAVGDTLRMRYPNPDGNLCDDYVPVTGVVRHVSTRGIFVADTANPANGFTAADYQRFGAVLDDSIYGPQATYFGTPTDLDENQRIIVLLTKEVNEREGILGMVVSADLFPRSTCASSDEGEIYYGRVPDPTGAVGAAYTVEAARLDVPALIAHEMTHIIQFGRRLNVTGATQWQALWEMESQATLAEEVIGHRFTGRQTGQNYDFTVAWENCASGSTGIAWYCDKFQDLALYYGFLTATSRAEGAPEQCSWLGRQDQGNDGPCIHQRMVYTGWSFLRWLSDHYGPALGGEEQLHRQMIDNTRAGFATIVSITGQPIEQLLGRWAATLYTDDRYAGVGGQLTLPSWNLYDVEQHLNTNARLQPYQHAFADAARNVSVRGGSSAYILVSGARAQSAIGMTTQSGAALPAYMRMWVVRVQ